MAVQCATVAVIVVESEMVGPDGGEREGVAAEGAAGRLDVVWGGEDGREGLVGHVEEGGFEVRKWVPYSCVRNLSRLLGRRMVESERREVWRG